MRFVDTKSNGKRKKKHITREVRVNEGLKLEQREKRTGVTIRNWNVEPGQKARRPIRGVGSSEEIET